MLLNKHNLRISQLLDLTQGFQGQLEGVLKDRFTDNHVAGGNEENMYVPSNRKENW